MTGVVMTSASAAASSEPVGRTTSKAADATAMSCASPQLLVQRAPSGGALQVSSSIVARLVTGRRLGDHCSPASRFTRDQAGLFTLLSARSIRRFNSRGRPPRQRAPVQERIHDN